MLFAIEQDRGSSSEYEVETIIDESFIQGKVYYEVKWVGYSEAENTWEPLEHLQNALDKVSAWNNSQKSKSKKTNADIYKRSGCEGVNSAKILLSNYSKIEKATLKKEKMKKLEESIKRKPKVWQKYTPAPRKFASKHQKIGPKNYPWRQKTHGQTIDLEERDSSDLQIKQNSPATYQAAQHVQNLFPYTPTNLFSCAFSGGSWSSNEEESREKIVDQNNQPSTTVSATLTQKMQPEIPINVPVYEPQSMIQEVSSQPQQPFQSQSETSTQGNTQSSLVSNEVGKEKVQKILRCFWVAESRCFEVRLTDGRVSYVKYEQMKQHRPDLIIDFYEQHLIQYQ